MNLKLARGLNGRATHENTLVMRRSGWRSEPNDQCLHGPGITWQVTMDELVNHPPGEGVGNTGFGYVVPHARARKASSQQQPTPRPQNPAHLGSIISPPQGTQVVEAAAV
jgi:hypothetical protein